MDNPRRFADHLRRRYLRAVHVIGLMLKRACMLGTTDRSMLTARWISSIRLFLS